MPKTNHLQEEVPLPVSAIATPQNYSHQYWTKERLFGMLVH